MFMFASPNYIIYKHAFSQSVHKKAFEFLNYNDEFENIEKKLKEARV